MTDNVGINRRSFCALVAGGAALGAGGLMVADANADQAAPADAAAPATVYIVDRNVTKPGEGQAISDEYLEKIVPWGEAQGAEFMGALVAPPIWMPMDSNVLTFTWKAAGTGGCWVFARNRGEIYDTWLDLRQRVIEQDRSYFADPADFEELANV